MARKALIPFLAQTSGYCCTYAFVQANRHKTRAAWAVELGVSDSTVQESRAMVRDSIITCSKENGCLAEIVSKED